MTDTKHWSDSTLISMLVNATPIERGVIIRELEERVPRADYTISNAIRSGLSVEGALALAELKGEAL